MEEIEQLLARAVNALESSNIDYVIVGGLAAILHGSPRSTTDIDVIVKEEKNLAQKLVKAFTDEGFDVMENQLRIAIQEKFNTSIFTPNSIIRIDLKVASNPDEFEVIREAQNGVFKDLSFKIASIQQILYGKLLYLGDISALSENELLDFNDVRDFINVYRNAENVDIEWLQRKAQKKNLQETLHRLLQKLTDI